MTIAGGWRSEIDDRIAVALRKLEAMSQIADDLKMVGDERIALLRPYRTIVDELYTQDLPLARILDEADLVVGAEGKEIRHEHIPVDTVVMLLTRTKKRVLSVARAVGELGNRIPAEVQPSLYGFAPGSVYIGFSAPEAPEGTLFQEDAPYFVAVRQALRAIGIVSQLVASGAPDETIAREVADPSVRDAAMEAVHDLAPSGRTAIEHILIGGKATTGSSTVPVARLAPDDRKRLSEDRDKPITATRQLTFTGTIREMDLDKQRFYLRQVDQLEGNRSIRGVYERGQLERARELLDRRVRVTGDVESDSADRPRLLFVKSVTVLEGSSQPRVLTDDADS